MWIKTTSKIKNKKITQKNLFCSNDRKLPNWKGHNGRSESASG